MSTSIDALPRTSSVTIKRLKSLGITTYDDLLTYFPSRYANYSVVSKIDRLQEGELVTVKGEIVDFRNVYARRGITLQKLKLKDDTGMIEVTWFNQPYLARMFEKAKYVSLAGLVKRFLHSFSLIPQEYDILFDLNQPTIHTGKLIAVYPEKRGLSSRLLRDKINVIFQYLPPDFIKDWLPEAMRTKYKLIDLADAYRKIHLPASMTEAEQARHRLGFDELFTIQLSSELIKREWKEEKVTFPFAVTPHRGKIGEFITQLPFQLTEGQVRTIEEILQDLSEPTAMNRFVQGDVGSGKTVVATVTAYVAFLNGFQTLIMAPTEILAQQHFQTLTKLLAKYPIKVGLQTGSNKIIKKKTKKSAEPQEHFDVVVGTQALITDIVAFSKVGLVVIDEQHRFGVRQRALLKQKGFNPHLMTMTATPIPRTIALTLYGELDMSVINELPKGRLPIKTHALPDTKRDDGYKWIREQIKATDCQVFVICPLIEESEKETMKSVKAASKEYELLTKVFKEFKVGLLHGKVKPTEKAAIMRDFLEKKYHILVATSVVEVGIDIPNATIMLIEGAERYGLAQLHQLRGRVGRSNRQSYCFLFSTSRDARDNERLSFFAKTGSGIKLAEYDLQLRGPGEVYGTRQSGFSDLQMADLSDYELIHASKSAVSDFLEQYSVEENSLLQAKIQAHRLNQVARD